MRVTRTMGYSMLAGVSGLCIAASIGVVWFSSYMQPILTDQKLHAEIVRLQGAAQIYRGRLDSYDGVCEDIGVQKNYFCQESSEAFAISVGRADGTFYCTDSTGYLSDQLLPVRPNIACLAK